jgi:hypothetical protein
MLGAFGAVTTALPTWEGIVTKLLSGGVLAAALTLAMGAFAHGVAQECKGCQEFSYKEGEEWFYWHKFSPPSELMRSCDDEVGEGHQDCHTDWVEDASCSTHPDCGGGGSSLVAVASEVDRLLTLVSEDRADDRMALLAALGDRIRAVPALSIAEDGRLLQLSSCDGRLIAQWEVSPEARGVLSLG